MKHLELVQIQGPLEDQWLQAIGRLYGSLDPKYQSLEFCKTLFNRNPSGFSLHLFALNEDNQAVGHYGVIPIEISIEGNKRLSGKPEAYLIEKQYRSYLAEYQGKMIPVGLAIPLRLVEWALAEGIDPLHVIAPDDVGMIHKRTGYKVFSLPLERYYFFCRPFNNLSFKRGIPGNGLYLLQSALYTFFRPFFVSSKSATLPFAVEALDERPHMGWSISKSRENLLWMLSTGLLQVIFDPHHPQEYALIRKCFSPGANLFEIVEWRAGSFVSSFRLLFRIIQGVKAQKGDGVFGNLSFLGDGVASLRLAARCLAFFKRRLPLSFYVQSKDPYFMEMNHLSFHPFFYSIF